MQHEESRRNDLGLTGHQIAILKQTMIEIATDDPRNVRMHPVLHFQHVYWKLRTHQSLKKTLVIVAFEASRTENCCR